MSASTLRDKIRNADDTVSEDTDVPEWNVKVRIIGMTGRQRAQFMQEFADDNGNVNFERLYPDLLLRTVADPETGELLFGEDDREWLLEKSGAVLDRVSTIAMQVSGLAPKAVDAEGKASSSDPSAGS